MAHLGHYKLPNKKKELSPALEKQVSWLGLYDYPSLFYAANLITTFLSFELVKVPHRSKDKDDDLDNILTSLG